MSHIPTIPRFATDERWPAAPEIAAFVTCANGTPPTMAG
jgi:hypothetical protein